VGLATPPIHIASGEARGFAGEDTGRPSKQSLVHFLRGPARLDARLNVEDRGAAVVYTPPVRWFLLHIALSSVRPPPYRALFGPPSSVSRFALHSVREHLTLRSVLPHQTTAGADPRRHTLQPR
jgi:hypothetical protein